MPSVQTQNEWKQMENVGVINMDYTPKRQSQLCFPLGVVTNKCSNVATQTTPVQTSHKAIRKDLHHVSKGQGPTHK